MYEIFLDAPNLGENEKRYLNEAIDSGYVSTAGPFVGQFEQTFASYLGFPQAVSLQSGTSALRMALYELGIGHGDEVIVPALTFIATVNPIMYLGAKPVFVDVNIETWNIEPAEIEKAITKKTKAILPVHLYGNPCNMDQIVQIAKKHNLFIIEDATEALGAKYRQKFVGTFGDFGCFSFNGNKTITTGGGGMVVGKDLNKLEHIRFLINQAKEVVDGAYYHPEIGFNDRMTNIEAALGLAQIEKLENFLNKKRVFNSIYERELGNFEGFCFQRTYENAVSSYWLSSLMFKNEIDICGVQQKLKEKNVPTRRVFMPIIEFPPYKKFKDNSCRNSYAIYERGLCLPSSTLNTEHNIAYVCSVIKDMIKSNKLGKGIR